jgi:tRNA(Ile)-lysidine synthase
MVAHVNYGLRGLDSFKDEKRVRETAQQCHLPFRLLRVKELQGIAQNKKQSLQDAAREIRYEFFSRLAHKEKAWGVAVAHHREDQAETVMDRLLRGAGPRGLSGLRACQEVPFLKGKPLRIWRPLLQFSKEDLRRYLVSRKMTWREDRTNGKDQYRRNQIRRHVIPFLARWNPRISAALFRIGEVTAVEDAYLENLLDQAGKKVGGRWFRRSYQCSTRKFGKLPLALQRRWVRRVAEKLCPAARGLSFERIEEVSRLWEGKEKGPRDLGFGLKAGRKGPAAFIAIDAR